MSDAASDSLSQLASSQANPQPEPRGLRRIGGVRSRASAETAFSHERLLRRRYAGWAPRYDRAFKAYSEATVAETMRVLGPPAPARLLDLACGTGLFLRSFRRASPATPCVGVDLSEAMLARARSRLRRESGLELLVGAAEAIPLPNQSVDAITFANAFHLVGDQDAALRECSRVLMPGGRLVIVDWCRDDFAMRMLALGLAVAQRLRRRVLTLAQLGAMLESAGFQVEEARRFKAPPAWGLMAFRARVGVGATAGRA